MKVSKWRQNIVFARYISSGFPASLLGLIKGLFSILSSIYDKSFCANSWQIQVIINYFWKKVPSYIFDRVLNTTLMFSQLTFTCSKSSIETLELCVKYVQKLTIRTEEQCQWGRFGVFIVNFEHISQLFLVFLLLTLSK